MRKLLFCLFLLVATIMEGHGQAQSTMAFIDEHRLFRNGLELFDKEQYNAARSTFEQYLRETHHGDMDDSELQRIDAEYYIAVSALRLFHDDAKAQFLDIIKKYPWHPKARMAYYELGNFYFDQKKYDDAIKYFELVDTDNLDREQRTEVQFKQGYSYFAKQKFKESGPYFDAVKAGNSRYAYAASYYAGYVEYEEAQYSKALTDLRRAEGNEEYASLVPYLIVNVFYKQKDNDALLNYVDTEVAGRKNVKNIDDIYVLTAEAYYNKGQYGKAAEYYGRYATAKRGRTDKGVTYRMAYSFYKNKEYQKAIDNFKVVAAESDSVGQYAAYYLGLSYLKVDNKPYALSALEQAANLNFNKKISQQARFDHAKLQYDMGNYSEAIRSVKQYNEEYPKGENRSLANELISDAYLKTNDYREAYAYLDKLENPSPKVMEAFQKVAFFMGSAAFNSTNFKAAVGYFDRSLENPIDREFEALAHFWKGEAYSAAARLPEAITSYSAIFRIPGSEQYDIYLPARYGIGYAYYNTKEYDKAQTHFKYYTDQLASAQDRQFYYDALIRLADCYYVSKNYDQALATYDKAVNGSTDRDYIYFQKGVIFGIKGNLEQSKHSFATLIDQFPKSRYFDNALFQRAQLDFERGNYATAISGFTELMQQRSSSNLVPHALIKRAVSHHNIQNYDEAIKDYQRVLDDFITHKVANSALLGLNESLTAAGQSEYFEVYLAKFKAANPSDESLENIEFQSAKNLYFSQKYEAAVKSLKEFSASYPKSALNYDARYYLAESYYRMNDYEEALKHHKVIINHRQGVYYNRALARASEMAFKKGDYRSAISYDSRLTTVANNKKELFNAWSGLMESYYNIGKYDSAEMFVDEILGKGNATVNAQNKALLYKGKIAFALNRYDDAINSFMQTLNSARDENGAEAQYLMGKALNRQGKFKQSNDVLYELNTNFAIYEYWLGKSFILIAENNAEMGEMFQAKGTLKSVIDNSPLPKIVEEAKLKLAELNDRKTPNNNVDTTEMEGGARE